MIKCIIIDDEPLAQEVLENFISRTPELQLAGKCNNALEAFKVLHQEPVDLMFLDVKMPGISGLDFVRSLKSPPAVIFTTAFGEHALTGFELEAVDYLLKPFTYERFRKSIDKLLKIYPSEIAKQIDYTYFKVSGRLVKVNHSDLIYAQSVKDYVQLKTAKGSYLSHMTMKYLAELLPSTQFLRIHRSYLVNKAFVNVINRSNVKVNEEVLPVGENYKQNLITINL